jgi:hypothetical protein
MTVYGSLFFISHWASKFIETVYERGSIHTLDVLFYFVFHRYGIYVQHVPSLDGGDCCAHMSSTVFLTLHMYCLFTCSTHDTPRRARIKTNAESIYEEAPPTIKFILIL